MVNSWQTGRWFDPGRAGRWIGLCLILILAAYLRFVNLRANPGWYSDEGVFISYAQHLLHGRWQAFAIVGSPMLVQRPPLFLFVLTAAFKLWGADILVLRGLTAAYGVASVLLLYVFVREAFGTSLALLSAGIMAICPWIVAYNRLGFTYNQMSPLFLVCVWACYKFTDKKTAAWVLVACVSAGLAFATDYAGVVACLLVGLVLLVYDWRWLLIGTLVISVVWLMILAPAFLASPQVFLDDVGFTFASKVTTSPLAQIVNIVLNYGELIRREGWIILGIVGLFLLPPRRATLLVMFVVSVTLLLILINFPPVGRGRHYMIHLFPFIALGIAAFIAASVPKVFVFLASAFNGLSAYLAFLNKNAVLTSSWQLAQKVMITVIVFIVLICPLMWMVLADVAQSVYGSYFIFTGNDDLSLTPERDINQVMDYLRSRITDDDLVLASHQIVWAAPTSRQTDWAITLVYDGKNAGYQPSIPRGRFAYDCSLQEATYVILDPLARDFAILVLPDMKDLIRQVEQWPLDFQAGDIQVYRNPYQ